MVAASREVIGFSAKLPKPRRHALIPTCQVTRQMS
jgi:hypothetical protein